MLALINRLPEPLRTKAHFWLGIRTIPLLRHLRPKLVEFTPERATLRINVSRRSRNGFKSMFLGAIASGSDCVAGLFPMKYMLETGHKTLPIFKDASSEFYKRINTYALFTCKQGKELRALCDEVVASGERKEFVVHVTVTAPAEFGDEVVARVSQTLSIRDLNQR